MNRLIFLGLVILIYFSCNGRHDDFSVDYVRQNAGHVLGLKNSKKTIVVFGAAWCIPCRHEIGVLNRAHDILGEDVEIVTFLVEGQSPGTHPSADDISGYSDNGEQKFKVLADNDWTNYQLFAQDKKLPLMLLVDETGKVVRQMSQTVKNEKALLEIVDEHFEVKTIAVEELEEVARIDEVAPTQIDDKDLPPNNEPTCKSISDLQGRLAFAAFSEGLCESDLRGLRKTWEAFFVSDDGHYFSSNDYPLDEASVEIQNQNNETGVLLSFDKVKEGTRCTLQVLVYPSNRFEFHDASCVPVGLE